MIMPVLATTHSLSDYLKLSISSYREQLRQGNAQSIEISYNCRSKLYRYSIQLSKSACHYGSYRYWWLCPKCSKRTSVLYCAGSYVCRDCIGANYHSQLQQPVDRIYNKLNSLRERFGWQVGIIYGIGERPKGMHRTTFNRLLVEYEQLTNKLIRTFY